MALQAAFQANTAANAIARNGSYVGQKLTVAGVYGAPYRSPYSEQWNFGIQREIFKGAIVSGDYIHNTTLKIGQIVDQNHIGAARYLNVAAAQAAIARNHCSDRMQLVATARRQSIARSRQAQCWYRRLRQQRP